MRGGGGGGAAPDQPARRRLLGQRRRAGRAGDPLLRAGDSQPGGLPRGHRRGAGDGRGRLPQVHKEVYFQFGVVFGKQCRGVSPLRLLRARGGCGRLLVRLVSSPESSALHSPLERRLSDLALGGGSALLWREDASLPAFGAVTALRLARRNHLQVPAKTQNCLLSISCIQTIAAAGVPNHCRCLLNPESPSVNLSCTAQRLLQLARCNHLQVPAKCLDRQVSLCTMLRLVRCGAWSPPGRLSAGAKASHNGNSSTPARSSCCELGSHPGPGSDCVDLFHAGCAPGGCTRVPAAAGLPGAGRLRRHHRPQPAGALNSSNHTRLLYCQPGRARLANASRHGAGRSVGLPQPAFWSLSLG